MSGYDLMLSFPPTNNRYYRKWRGRMVISEEGRRYKQSTWIAVRRAIPDISKLTGRLSVSIYATMPDKRRRDLDGIPKGLLDSLNGLAWGDDEQIDSLTITRVGTQKPGKVFVRIEEVGDPKEDYEPMTIANAEGE